MIFVNLFFPQWDKYLLSCNKPASRGPCCGLDESEIITIILLYHSSNFKHFKNFYNGILKTILSQHFPKAPSYQRFIELTQKATVPLLVFMNSKSGKKTGIYYIDSTCIPVCKNLRAKRNKVFKGLAAHGKTSTGWFFGLKLHLVFNNRNEIMAVKLTPGNISDTAPVDSLTKNLLGKLFGDKGYLGKNLAKTLLERGLNLMTKVRSNMKRLPMLESDRALLNCRNMVETIIGHIKEFSSLNVPKHRSVTNAFVHICAAIISYQLNPIKPKELQLIAQI